jgi:DNA-binding response OmpR family regulator
VSKGASILLAEHDPGVLELYKTLAFAHPEWRFQTCHDGVTALQFAQQDPPDLVIADLGLPMLNAFELCAKFQTQPATSLIPVIIVTGHAQRAFRKAAQDVGARELLTKPFRIGDLIAAIERALADGP